MKKFIFLIGLVLVVSTIYATYATAEKFPEFDGVYIQLSNGDFIELKRTRKVIHDCGWGSSNCFTDMDKYSENIIELDKDDLKYFVAKNQKDNWVKYLKLVTLSNGKVVYMEDETVRENIKIKNNIEHSTKLLTVTSPKKGFYLFEVYHTGFYFIKLI